MHILKTRPCLSITERLKGNLMVFKHELKLKIYSNLFQTSTLIFANAMYIIGMGVYKSHSKNISPSPKYFIKFYE